MKTFLNFKFQISNLLKSRANGFTLIEIMVAAVIIGIMSGAGVAAYRRLNDRAVVEGAAKKVEQALRETQKRAASGVKPTGCNGTLLAYTITMGGVLGPRRYMIQADCSTTDPSPQTFDLPGETRFPSDKSVRFPVLGRGATAQTIWVQNDSGQVTYEIRVNSAGAISGLGLVAMAPTPTPTLPPLPTNLVPNPGFETGSPASWSTNSSGTSCSYANPNFQWTSSDRHEGSYSVRIYMSLGTGCTAEYRTSTTAALVTAGTSYSLSGWIKTQSVTNSAYLRIGFYNASGSLITSFDSTSQAGTTDWSQVSRTVTAPTGAVRARFHVRLVGRGTAFFDDLRFVEI